MLFIVIFGIGAMLATIGWGIYNIFKSKAEWRRWNEAGKSHGYYHYNIREDSEGNTLKRPDDNQMTIWSVIGMAFLLLLCGGAVGLAASFIAGAVPYHHQTVHRSYPLEALRDGHGIQGAWGGNFLLSTGYMSDTPSYTFYMKMGNRYQLHTEAAGEYADVVYDDNPRVEFTCKIGNGWWDMTAVDDVAYCNVDQQKIVLYVPKGTIQSGYTLDTK